MNYRLIFLFLFIFSPMGVLYGQVKIVFIGDSLTFGYGIVPEKAYPSLIKQKWVKEGRKVKVINASISGSTTASGLARIKWQLKGNPKWIIIALGANDGLRGIPAKETKKNLNNMILMAQKQKISLILIGMKVPPNYGKKYQQDFESIYLKLSKKYNVPLIPFLLDGVAGEPHLNQDDAIHPNEKGHEMMAQHLKKYLDKIIWH